MDRRIDSSSGLELSRPAWSANSGRSRSVAVDRLDSLAGPDLSAVPWPQRAAKALEGRRRVVAALLIAVVSTLLVVEYAPTAWRSVAYRDLRTVHLGSSELPSFDPKFPASEYVIIEHRWTGEVYGEFRDENGRPVGSRIVPEPSLIVETDKTSGSR